MKYWTITKYFVCLFFRVVDLEGKQRRKLISCIVRQELLFIRKLKVTVKVKVKLIGYRRGEKNIF